MEEKFTCERCGREWPRSRMKEVKYEEGRDRIRKQVCPECLDQMMNEAGKVRGVVGDVKTAAAHLSGRSGAGERKSFGTRGS